MDKPGGVHGSVCRWPRVRVGGSASASGICSGRASASGTCNGCPLGRKSAGRLPWIAALTLFARNDGRWMAMTDKEGAMTKEEEVPGWRGKRSQSFLPEPGQRCRLGIRRKKCH